MLYRNREPYLKNPYSKFCILQCLAPTKTEDDIVELWSNLRNPSNINKTISKQNEHENKKDRPLRNKLRIGATSSTSNPEFLNASRISSCLREKYLASTNKISCPNESIIQTTSNSVNGKKNRKLDEDNMNLDPIQSNENFKRKTRSSNSTSENSSHKLREIVIDGCNIAMLYDLIFILIFTLTYLITYLFY